MWNYSRKKKDEDEDEEISLHCEEKASGRIGRDDSFLFVDGCCGCSSNALVNDKDAI